MISQARVEYARIAPRKVRYVIDLIRKKTVRQAQSILNGSPRRASEIIRKLLNQAVDAAQKNSKIDDSNLFVARVTADGGPTMRRFRAASMGRGMIIRKRTSHISLELDLLKPGAVVPQAKKSAVREVASTAKKAKTVKPATKKLAGAK